MKRTVQRGYERWVLETVTRLRPLHPTPTDPGQRAFAGYNGLVATPSQAIPFATEEEAQEWRQAYYHRVWPDHPRVHPVRVRATA